MPTYLWYSKQNDEHIEMVVPIASRDVVPDLPPYDWERVLEMPAFKRKTFLDGQRKDLTDFKAIGKIQKQMADMASDDLRRNEMNKEIHQRKKLKP